MTLSTTQIDAFNAQYPLFGAGDEAKWAQIAAWLNAGGSLAELATLDADLSSTYAAKGVTADGARVLTGILNEGTRSAVLTALGDSTGVGDFFAPNMLLDWLGGEFPAYNVLKVGWSDTNQGYNRPAMSQVGTAGVPYVALDGSGDYVTTPDSALNSIVGDIAVVAVVRATDWTPGGTQSFVTKFGSAPNISWAFNLGTNGVPIFLWSADGTNTISKSATAALPGVTDGVTDLAVAVTLDVDNGAVGNDVKFYTAPFTNGVIGTWTQLGTTVTTAGVTSIFDGNRGVEVGGAFSGSAQAFNGRVYYAEVRSGLDLATSPIVACMHPGLWMAGTTFTGPVGSTWTLGGNATVTGAPTLALLNGCTDSTYITYATDVTRFGKLTPIEPIFTLINYGLNGSTSTAMSTDYLTVVDALITKYPLADVLCMTQNPKATPEYTAAEIRAQAFRMGQVRQVAAARNVMLADTYLPFLPTPAPLLDGGIHPDAAGVALQVDVLKTLFTAWV